MQIKTSLTRAELDTIAADIGMRLIDARSVSVGHSVLLRPRSCMDDEFRVRGSQGRRVYAVTWAGHYAFMAAVFGADPAAEIKSTLAHWRSAEHFFADAPMQQPEGHQSPMNWADARY